jgi:hypothetical protein
MSLVALIVFEDIVVSVSTSHQAARNVLRWSGQRPWLNEDVLDGRLQFANVLFDPVDGGLKLLNIESTLESDFDRE